MEGVGRGGGGDIKMYGKIGLVLEQICTFWQSWRKQVPQVPLHPTLEKSFRAKFFCFPPKGTDIKDFVEIVILRYDH